MKVYISGPMTGLPDLNVHAFRAMAARLHAMGYTVVDPSVVHVEGWTWADYMHHDLRIMRGCDAIVFLHGWQGSKGACIERRYAKRLGLIILDI